MLAMATNNVVNLFVDMLGEVVTRLTPINDAYCKIMMYLGVATSVYVNFTVAVMSLNKTIAIMWPLKATSIITHRTTIITLTSVTCAIYGIYLMCFWSYGLEETWCAPVKKYERLTEFEVIFGMVQTYTSAIIILICTIICVHSLAKQHAIMKAKKCSKIDYDQVRCDFFCITLWRTTPLPDNCNMPPYQSKHGVWYIDIKDCDKL
jgi:hypothetical protein